MRHLSLALVIVAVSCAVGSAEPPVPKFKKLQLTDKFYCEGAYYGDFNKDGKLDVVSGPFWYEGPDFQKKHEIRAPKQYDPHNYADNFLTFTGDFNGDGWTDVFYVPWPGTDGFWYENPGGKEGPWKQHPALKDVGNESPMWGDVNGDGRPELVYNITGYLGYATYDPAKPDEPWVFHPITPKGGYHKYTHGIGFGDINGDGRVDIVESAGWWEQPAQPKADEPWIWHPFKFAADGAQMLVYDVDGDGLSDVITAWHCHQYGLVWCKQLRNDKGEITWQQHVILPPNPDVKSNDLRISQLHAFDLVDMNGDGLKDFVTGKRFWAHGPKGDAEPDAPAVVYWFELRRDKEKGPQFIPHKIDDNSGVGTQVAAVDLNGDKVPDVIVGNKKGTFVFLSEQDHASGPAAADVQGLYEGAWKDSAGEHRLEARVVATGPGTYKVFVRQPLDEGKVAKVELEGKTEGDAVRFAGKADDVEWGASYADGAIKGTRGQGAALELKRGTRQLPTLGAKPPEEAVVLLDGKNFDELAQRAGQEWKLVEGDAVEVPKGGMNSKRQFDGSFKLHVEFKIPLMPQARDQGRGNSGVYLPNGDEIQVLDSFGMTTYKGGGCGGLYAYKDPDLFDQFSLVSLPPLAWQTFDVEYRVEKKDGKPAGKPRVTVVHNGVKIHDNADLRNDARQGGFHFQDHGNSVEYRNIWVLPLEDK